LRLSQIPGPIQCRCELLADFEQRGDGIIAGPAIVAGQGRVEVAKDAGPLVVHGVSARSLPTFVLSSLVLAPMGMAMVLCGFQTGYTLSQIGLELAAGSAFLLELSLMGASYRQSPTATNPPQ